MKKLLLFSLSLAIGLSAFAQQSTVKNRYQVLDYAQTLNTTYDLQANHFVSNRMYQLPNGSVGVVATMSHQDNTSASDRGTGYNFFNGAEWNTSYDDLYDLPRIESFKTGWPSIAQWGETGEILVSHGAGHLQCFTREVAGQGEWIYMGALPDHPEDYPYDEYSTWPRVVTSGSNHNIIHVVACLQHAGSETITHSVIYRSEDAVNWEVSYGPLADLGYEMNYFSADDYALAANGHNVALLYSGSKNNSVWLFKSTDDGLTWESRRVWQDPYEGADLNDENFYYEQELYRPMNGSVVIDNNGVVHVALNVFLMIRYEDTNPGSYSYYYGRTVDGIVYWNDTQEGPIASEDGNLHNAARLWWPMEDDEGYTEMHADPTKWIGYIPMYEDAYWENDKFYHSGTDYFNKLYGASGHPALSCDPNGNLACAYSAPCIQQEDPSAPYYFRHIYVSYRNADDGIWRQAVDDLTDPEENFELSQTDNLYTISVPNTVNPGEFWFGFQSDSEIGFYCGANSSQSSTTDNTIYITKVIANPEMIGTGEHYHITATANPTEGGTVNGGGYYAPESYCTLTAIANEGYAFTNWTKNGAVVSTEASYTFTVTEDADYVANFSSTADYWEVDENAYSGNMTVTAVIQIDGIEQFRTDLELGAFCGDECRGIMRPVDTYYDPEWMPHYYLFLTVHGENGDVITFRLYDHSLNQELDLTCANTLTFSDNAMIGDIEPPYAINFMNALTQTTNFRTGWNWWSSYVDLTEINGLAALEEGLGSAGVQIKSQSKFVINYGTTWLGGLNAINNEQTLKVQTNAPVTVDLTSKPVSPADHPLTLNAGWNWIGYPCTNSMSLTQAFANYTPSNGDQVKTQSSYAIYRAGIGWMGALQTLTPGNGLFFYTSTGGTLVFSDGSRNDNAELAENITADNNHWVPDMSAYPSNMTVTAVVELEDVKLQSERYELAAFANGEVRGSARLMYVEPMDRYMAFLTVTGDEAAELHFGLYDTETGAECLESNDLLVFTADAMVGELESPMVVSFRGTTGLSDLERSLQVYPNPVACGERFLLTLPINAKAQIEVVNTLGVVVETSRATSVQAPASPGVYTLRITVDGKGTISRKLVVR